MGTDSPAPSGVDEVIARARIATAADNDLLVELMAHVPMEGSLAVATRRDPNFFALYEMQRGRAEAFAYDDGDVAGMGAMLVRDGFLDERPQPVGYLGDLRIRGTGRARRAFPWMYAQHFARISSETGCEAFLTGVLASNAMALAALAPAPSVKRKRARGRAVQPHYELLRKFDMASVQMVLPRTRPRVVTGVDVGCAGRDDVGAIASFLADDHRRRPFGWRFDDGELEHRLARWPGFTLEDTFVARAAGRIVGVCTAWDASPVKRYRVMRYAGDMRAIKLAVAVASKIVGCPALPEVGEDFRSLYLTNLSVVDDSPVILRALLEHVYVLAWQRRVHFFSLPLYENDPLAPALKGYVVRRLPFHLYAVTSSAHPRTTWPSGRPGFEMALA